MIQHRTALEQEGKYNGKYELLSALSTFCRGWDRDAQDLGPEGLGVSYGACDADCDALAENGGDTDVAVTAVPRVQPEVRPWELAVGGVGLEWDEGVGEKTQWANAIESNEPRRDPPSDF